MPDNKTPKPLDSDLSLQQRYSSAVLELSGRFQARQNTMNTFTSVIFAVIAGFFTFASYGQIRQIPVMASNQTKQVLVLKGDQIQQIWVINKNGNKKLIKPDDRIRQILVLKNGLLQPLLVQTAQAEPVSVPEEQSSSLITRELILSFVGMCIPALGFIFNTWVGFHSVKVRLLTAYCRACELRASGSETTYCWYSDTWQTYSHSFRLWSNISFGFVLFLTCLPSAFIAWQQGEWRAIYIDLVVMGAGVLLIFTWLSHKRKSGMLFICGSLFVIVSLVIINLYTSGKFEFDIVTIFSSLAFILCAASLIAFCISERKRYIFDKDGTLTVDDGKLIFWPVRR